MPGATILSSSVPEEISGKIRDRLKARFAEEVQTHYNFLDRHKVSSWQPMPKNQMKKPH